MTSYTFPAKILVVDDEPDLEAMIRLKFRKRLKLGELDFIFARNGVQALEQLRSHPETDVVLTDINMPQMDGLTLLDRLNEQDYCLKTVIISAYGDMGNIRLAMNRGAYDFLTKPLDLSDLELTLNKTIVQVQQLKRIEQEVEALLDGTRKMAAAHDALSAVCVTCAILCQTIFPFKPAIKVYLARSFQQKQAAYLCHHLIWTENSYVGFRKNLVEDAELEQIQQKDGTVQDGSTLWILVRLEEELLTALALQLPGPEPLTEADYRFINSIANSLRLVLANLRHTDHKQMALIGQMASSIIHDLKTPLAIIRSYAEIVTMPECPVEKRNRFLDIIMKQVDRLSQMINDILEFARGAIRLDPQWHDTAEYIRTVTTAFEQKLTESGLRLETILDFDGQVWLDGPRFYRVLFNIIGNAMDAMKEGGVCTVRVHRADDWIYFTISDTGPGISEEIRAQLFQPFATFGKRNGTGLGLAIARRIVEEHGGVITLTSEVDKGAEFVIKLPYRTAG